MVMDKNGTENWTPRQWAAYEALKASSAKADAMSAAARHEEGIRRGWLVRQGEISGSFGGKRR